MGASCDSKFLIFAAAVALFVLAVDSTDLFSPVCPTNGLPAAFLECNGDCREQHNSSSGYCDENANCICSGVLNDSNIDHTCHYNFDLLSLLNINPPVCHCASDATPGLEAFWRGICDVDCVCHHGAQSGTCVFGPRQCICNYPDGFVWERDEGLAICFTEGMAAAGVCAVAATLTNAVPPGC